MEDLVKEYITTKDDNRKSLLKDLISQTPRELLILGVIEALHSYLTSSEVDKRIKACELLSDVLNEIDIQKCMPQELHVLVEFLCCRLQDHFSIHPPTLRSLMILSRSENLPNSVVESIIKTIFKEVHVPSCMQSERSYVYSIFSNFVESCTDEVVKMGDEFLCGVISAVDGEQDPRNLLKVFDLAYNIVQSNIPLTKMAEEFFEVVSCYFPIDFEPPPKLSESKNVVTNQQLVTGLRKFLSSSPLFAPYCIPLLLEKLESDVQSAKLDSLHTLISCLKLYSVTELRPFLRSLWVRIRTEAMYSQNEEIDELGMKAITDLVTILSKVPHSANTTSKSDLDNFIQDMLEDCLPRLTEHLHEKLSWISAKLLMSGAEASKQSCKKILSSVVPILLKHLDVNSKVILAEKRLAMEMLVNATKAAAGRNFDKNVESHPLYDNKDDIIQTFCRSITLKEFILLRTVALAGIAVLCRLGMLITPDDQLTIVSSIIHCMENESEEPVLADLCLTAGFVSSYWPDLAVTHIMPVLKKTISNSFDTEPKLLSNKLQFLSAISTHVDVVTTACELIKDQLLSCMINENNATKFELLLNSLSSIVKSIAHDVPCLEYFERHLLLSLLGICVKVSLVPTLPAQCCSCCSGQQTFSNQCITLPIMQKVCEISRTICQKLKPCPETQELCTNLTRVFIDCDLTCLGIKTTDKSFDPFSNYELPLQTRLVCFLTATLCAFDKSVKIVSLDKIYERVLLLCLNTKDQPSYVAAAKCLAGLINKQKEPSPGVLQKVMAMTDELLKSNLDYDEMMNRLSVVIWINKALVIRSHPQAMALTDVLFKLFTKPDFGRISAESFDIILRDTEEVLNPSSHASIRLMYRQRFFQSVLPRLIDGFQTTESFDMDIDMPDNDSVVGLSLQKANYLTALAHMLKFLPKQVLYQHLTSLLPLLVKSLNTEEGPLLISVLATLSCLVQESQSAIEPHVAMLLKHFMRLSKFTGNMNVRTEALKCIGTMTLLPVDILLPHKKLVTRTLVTALDDKKRLVRKEAVKARTEWFLLGDV